ncbi:hypothetical protein KO317_03850 [Candidatus Micrarchaeota archaeon]|nr:hypothetical protein [Candidatus Micrarchaeota archaeon]
MPKYKDVSMKRDFEENLKKHRRLTRTFPNKIRNNTLIENGTIFAFDGQNKIRLGNIYDTKSYTVKEIRQLTAKAEKENLKIFIIWKDPKVINSQIFGFYLIKPLKGFESLGYDPDEIRKFGGLI